MLHVVEQRRAEEEAVGRQVGLAAVDDDRRAGLGAGRDVARDPVAVLGGDQRAHVGVRVGAVADRQLRQPRRDRVDQPVADVADRHRDRDRHAPLAGRAVRRRHRGVGGHVDVGVGQHQHVVLRPAERLHPLAVRGAGLVDVARDRRRADEAHRGDVRVAQQPVDRLLVTLDHGEHAVGQAGVLPQLGQEQRRRRVLLARLQDERVAGRDRVRAHPQRHHRGEVERRDAGHDAERLADRVDVDIGRDLLGEPALQQVRHAGGELDVLQPAGDLAECVGDHLAVLGGDDPGQLVLSRCSSSRNSNSTAARFDSEACRHSRAASFADATAASTSATLASPTEPVCSPVAGLNTGEVRPDCPGVNRPSIQCEIKVCMPAGYGPRGDGGEMGTSPPSACGCAGNHPSWRHTQWA